MSNVTGGFRKAGVYPFDPKRVSALKGVNKSGDGTCSGENSASSGDESSSESGDHGDNEGDIGQNDKICSGGDHSCDGSQNGNGGISNSNETLYQKRYDEGYDLFDPEYVSWF